MENYAVEKTMTLTEQEYQALKLRLQHAGPVDLTRLALDFSARPGLLLRFFERGGGLTLVEALRGLGPGPGEEGRALDALLQCLTRVNLTVQMIEDSRLVYQLGRLQRDSVRYQKTDSLLRQLFQINKTQFEAARRRFQESRKRAVELDNQRRQKQKSEKQSKRSRSRGRQSSSSSERRTRAKVRWARTEELQKVRFFRVDDEPSARGLSRSQVQEYNRRLQAAGWECVSSEEMRHRESRLESSSIHQFREEERALMDKLASVRQQIQFYKPLPLGLQPPAIETQETKAHALRIATKLACFYRPTSIPADPAGAPLNSEDQQLPKIIPFNRVNEVGEHRQSYRLVMKQDPKRARGILRRPDDEKPDALRPEFQQIMAQVHKCQDTITPERIAELLRNCNETEAVLLQRLLNNLTLAKRLERKAEEFVPPLPDKADFRAAQQFRFVNPKYKTIHCKYFHSPQGCERGDDCTYIHEKDYAGRLTPEMLRNQQQKTAAPGAYPYAYPYGYYPQQPQEAAQYSPHAQYYGGYTQTQQYPYGYGQYNLAMQQAMQMQAQVQAQAQRYPGYMPPYPSQPPPPQPNWHK